MAQPWIDKLKTAQILVEAAYESDAVVAHRYQLTTRTLRAYRQRLNDDEELTEIFQKKLKVYEADWGAKLAQVQIKGYEAIESLFQSVIAMAEKVERSEPKPEIITAMARLLDSLSEALSNNAQTGLTRDIIHARIRHAGTGNQEREQINETVTQNGYVITDKSELYE